MSYFHDEDERKRRLELEEILAEIRLIQKNQVRPISADEICASIRDDRERDQKLAELPVLEKKA
jgi:hypothetical protein